MINRLLLSFAFMLVCSSSNLTLRITRSSGIYDVISHSAKKRIFNRYAHMLPPFSLSYSLCQCILKMSPHLAKRLTNRCLLFRRRHILLGLLKETRIVVKRCITQRVTVSLELLNSYSYLWNY